MPGELTNDQIALLCRIGEHDPSAAGGDRILQSSDRRDLERLLREDYVVPSNGPSGTALQLTAKGIDFLGKRGAGLNEA